MRKLVRAITNPTVGAMAAYAFFLSGFSLGLAGIIHFIESGEGGARLPIAFILIMALAFALGGGLLMSDSLKLWRRLTVSIVALLLGMTTSTFTLAFAPSRFHPPLGTALALSGTALAFLALTVSAVRSALAVERTAAREAARLQAPIAP